MTRPNSKRSRTTSPPPKSKDRNPHSKRAKLVPLASIVDGVEVVTKACNSAAKKAKANTAEEDASKDTDEEQISAEEIKEPEWVPLVPPPTLHYKFHKTQRETKLIDGVQTTTQRCIVCRERFGLEMFKPGRAYDVLTGKIVTRCSDCRHQGYKNKADAFRGRQLAAGASESPYGDPSEAPQPYYLPPAAPVQLGEIEPDEDTAPHNTAPMLPDEDTALRNTAAMLPSVRHPVAENLDFDRLTDKNFRKMFTVMDGIEQKFFEQQGKIDQLEAEVSNLKSKVAGMQNASPLDDFQLDGSL